MILINLIGLISLVSTATVNDRLRVHPDEGFYDFPISLGSELSLATGRCAVGNQVYEKCFIKIHSYGISIHSADTTLSSIPLIAFQSHSTLFPEPSTSSIIIVDPVDENKKPTRDDIKIKTVTIRDLSLPRSRELVDQLTSGRLRVAINVARADIQMDEQEYVKLLNTQPTE